MKPTSPKSLDLENIFLECGKDLNAYFARRIGETQSSADLVQESFLQFARKLKEGEKVASPRAYLFGIARNLTKAFLRKQPKEPTAIQTEPANAPSTEPDERIEAARQAIASLPMLQREILDLRFTHGLSYAELATTLGIPAGTVRSRLHHAILLLREKLEEENNPKTAQHHSPPQKKTP